MVRATSAEFRDATGAGACDEVLRLRGTGTAPSTVTLYAGPLKEVAGLAGEELTFDTTKAATPSRLVLIDTTELGWPRARCRAKAHRLLPADPVLVGFTTLQQWLWQRLQVPAPAHA